MADGNQENHSKKANHHNHTRSQQGAGADQPKTRVGRIKGVIQKSDYQERKKFETKVEELTEALQRERADIINIRRRHEEQMAGLRNIVKASVVRDLLPVIDNFERALKHIPKDIESHDYVKGISGIVKQFEKTLNDVGVERVKTIGEDFDPRYHEAVSMEAGEGTREVVSEELQAGYTLGDEVIRHAMVKVRTEK